MPTRTNEGESTSWLIRLTGDCRVFTQGEPTGVVLRTYTAALVTLLAVDGPTSRERVCGLLWPDAAARAARNNLKVLVHKLRDATSADFVVGRDLLSLGPAVKTDWNALPKAESDRPVAELLGAVAQIESHEFSRWLDGARQLLRRRRHEYLASEARRLEEECEYSGALRVVDVILRENPLDECALRHKLNLHFMRGDRASAIAEYESFERLLKDELGTRPSQKTLTLLSRIEATAPSDPDQPLGALTALRQVPPFVGRGEELKRLRDAWAAGRSVLVVGEAAIGKSRLIRAFAEGSAGTVVVQARPGDADVPFGLVSRGVRLLADRFPDVLSGERRSALRRVLPDFGDRRGADDGGDAPVQVRSVIEALLVDAMSAGLRGIIVDDLHFADTPSVELLCALFESDRLRLLRWLFAQRPAQSTRLEEMRRVLEASHHVDCVLLRPFAREDVVRLIELIGVPCEDAEHQAARLLKHTGGSPGFLVETLRQMAFDGDETLTGALPLPPSVAKLIEQRLLRLPERALLIARIAAVAGTDFSIELAEQLTGQPALALANAWRQLEDAQILHGSSFAHDLAHEAALGTLPGPVAQRTHQQVAEFLQKRGAAPARIAHHWQAAKVWDRAGSAYLEAAVIARRASGRSGEIDLLDKAADCFDRARLPQRAFEALAQRVDSLLFLDEFDRTRAGVEELMQRANDPADRLSALSLRAELRTAEHADHTALAWVEEARELAEQLGAEERKLKLMRLQAYCLGWLGRAADALPIASELRAWALRHREHSFSAIALLSYANTLQLNGRDRDALAAFDEVEEVAVASNRNDVLVEALPVRAECELSVGLLAKSIQTIERASRVHRKHAGEALEVPISEVALADRYRQVGRYGDALKLLDQALNYFDTTGNAWTRAEAAIALAHLYVTLGQSARARRLLPVDDEVLAPGLQLRWLHARGLIAHFEARPALELWKRAQALLPSIERSQQAGWVVLACMSGELPADEAVRRLQMALDTCAKGSNWRYTCPMRLRLMQALLRTNQSDAASALADELVEELARTDLWGVYMPEVWIAIAQTYDAAGRIGDAAEAMRCGRLWIQERALPNVPAAFQESFLQRNRFNRLLRTSIGGRSRD